MKKKFILAGAAAVLYCALLNLLLLAESAYTPAPGEETISTFPKAMWYSLTTLTTVGYGDIYPHTVAGRIIGTLFMLLSVGFLVFVISAVLSALKKRLIPKLRLRFASDREWYLFAEYNTVSAALARNLKREDKNCLCVFCRQELAEGTAACPEGLRVVFTPEEALRLHRGKGHATVFCMSDSSYDNYRDAAAIRGAHVCCMSEYEPDRPAERITVFYPCQCCARLYWQRFPIQKNDETVVLIGGGKYAAALLEQALMLNVYSPDQHLTYLVCGDPSDFSGDHPYLGGFLSLGTTDPGRDSLIFLSAQWKENAQRIQKADRVIVCFDDEEDTLQTLFSLNRYFPVNGAIHARLSKPFEHADVFGGVDEIFTPELVLRKELDRAAIALNDIYRSSTGGTAPSWEELSGFLRRSNLASADHLQVKIRILLGDKYADAPLRERCAAAYQAYLQRKGRDADTFRRIEHERWMRFHLLNNWQYAPDRDNARRLHPLLLPYDRIDQIHREKDDYAWELLGMLAQRDEKD